MLKFLSKTKKILNKEINKCSCLISSNIEKMSFLSNYFVDSMHFLAIFQQNILKAEQTVSKIVWKNKGL
jgi:hypothetical protein